MDPNSIKPTGTPPPPLPNHNDAASTTAPKPVAEPAHAAPMAHMPEDTHKAVHPMPDHSQDKGLDVSVKHDPTPLPPHSAPAEHSAMPHEEHKPLDVKPPVDPAPVAPKDDAPAAHADIAPPPAAAPEVHPPHPANAEAATPAPMAAKPAVAPLNVPPTDPHPVSEPVSPMPHGNGMVADKPVVGAEVSPGVAPATEPLSPAAAPPVPTPQGVVGHMEQGAEPKSHAAMIVLLVVAILAFVIGLFLFLSARCIGPDLGGLFPAFACESAKTISPEDQGLILPSADLSSPEAIDETTP